MKSITEFVNDLNEANAYLSHVRYKDVTLPDLNEHFFHDDLNPALISEENAVFYDIPDAIFTDMILHETLNIIQESGSLPDVVPVPKALSDVIVGDFADRVLKSMKIFNMNTITGLGSTRAMLKNLPTAKSIAGDLDLLIVSTTDNRQAAKKLADWAKSKGYDFQVAFGNIFSVAWPYDGQKYQIDLMISNASDNDEVYNYMRKFKYFSDEDPIQNGDFILKGAHRSELAKTMVKAIGLSAAENGFKQFIWDTKYDNVFKLADDLEKKAKRFRDLDKQQQTMNIADVLRTKVKTLDKLKNELSDNGLLRNRYPNAIFKNYPKAFDLMIDMLFKKEDVTTSWEKILDKKFGITDSISRMNKFEDVLKLTRELLAKRIVTPRSIVGVFNDIKSAFDNGKASGMWNRALEEYIEKQLPFLKKYWL